MKVNLGCGQNKKQGFVNVDKYDSFKPDVVHDLEIFPWPFIDDCASEIEMHHSLEHMGASTEVFLKIIQELYRIAKHECKLRISVPHPRSRGFEGDPSHVRIITPDILALFSLKNNKEWAKKGWPNTPFAEYLEVNFEITDVLNSLTDYWLNEMKSGRKTKSELDFAVDSYFGVIDQIQIDLAAIKPFKI